MAFWMVSWIVFRYTVICVNQIDFGRSIHEAISESIRFLFLLLISVDALQDFTGVGGKEDFSGCSKSVQSGLKPCAMNSIRMFDGGHTFIAMQAATFVFLRLARHVRQIRITQQGSAQLNKIKTFLH